MKAALGLMASYFLSPSSAFASQGERIVYESCLVDEAHDIRRCYIHVVYPDTSHESFVTPEFVDSYWFSPQLGEALNWTIVDDTYLEDIERTHWIDNYYNHDLLYDVSVYGEDLSTHIRTDLAELTRIPVNEGKPCNHGRCASAIISGTLVIGGTGVAGGIKTGKYFGPKGAAAGAVIGGTGGAIAGATGAYSSHTACSPCGSGGRTRGELLK